MPDEIKYGFPKIFKNGENVGFKTYTTCVYDMNGNLLEDRLRELALNDENIADIKRHKSRFINAVLVGIDNTGVTDVWEPLQRLLNTHKCVFLPAGTYKISHYIKLNNGNILEGESVNTTFIDMVGTDVDTSASILVCQDVSNIVINNISILGHNNPVNKRAIKIMGSSIGKSFKNITISNTYIYNVCDTGIYINSRSSTSGSDCSINNVRIIQNLTHYVNASAIDKSYKTGKCVDITLNDKKDVVNIDNLLCTSEEYLTNTFTNSYCGNFVIKTNNTTTYTENKVPIIIGININGVKNLDSEGSCPVHISNSTFEGMTEAIHCKASSVSIVNCAFNLSIVGALLADTCSDCQIIGCTFLTLYNYNGLFGYNIKKRLLNDEDAYNLKIYKENGDIETDPQPFARMEIYDISTNKRMTNHPYLAILFTIGDVVVFTTEKNTGESKFIKYRLKTIGRDCYVRFGDVDSITDE